MGSFEIRLAKSESTRDPETVNPPIDEDSESGILRR